MLPHSRQFDAIGTKWRIETNTPLTPVVAASISACIESFDHTYSRFRSDSLVGQAARQAGTYHFPDDSVALFKFYRTLYDLTDGQVTPLIGAMLERAGYDASYSLSPNKQSPLPTWDEAMIWQHTTLTTMQPVVIDVGAAGKGYLVDKISHILDAAEVSDYVVDASGDIRHRGKQENIVGLENPFNTSEVIGSISVQNESLCASATNRRTWGKGLHHVFDPRTMLPTQEIVATWVIAKEGLLADGIATALFFVTPERLLETFKFEYVRMHYNGSLEYSLRFKEGLFV